MYRPLPETEVKPEVGKVLPDSKSAKKSKKISSKLKFSNLSPTSEVTDNLNNNVLIKKVI